jgi:hypothetical protein
MSSHVLCNLFNDDDRNSGLIRMILNNTLEIMCKNS